MKNGFKFHNKIYKNEINIRFNEFNRYNTFNTYFNNDAVVPFKFCKIIKHSRLYFFFLL